MQDWLRAQPDFEDPTSSSSQLPALYADLAAHKAANRSSFDASVSWWKKTLFQACLEGAQQRHSAKRKQPSRQIASTSTPSLKEGAEERSYVADRFILHAGQNLLDDLTLDDVGRALGLGTVVMELRASKDVVRLSDFVRSKVPIQRPLHQPRSLSFALASMALYPISWATSQVSAGLSLGNQEEDPGERDWQLAQGDWVLLENVEQVGEALLKLHQSSSRLSPLECLFSKQQLRSLLAEPALDSCLHHSATTQKGTLSDQDFDVLLKYLVRDCGAALVDGDVVKLENHKSQGVGVITDADRGVVNVKETYTRIEGQIDDIERRIKERHAKIEQCVKDKRKEQALSYLRSKKNLEQLLQRRTDALETLHGVLVKIEQAASDVEIMKAYETSTMTLKTLLGDTRLRPGTIDATMDAMQDTLADADEVRSAIESGQEGAIRAAGADADIDESEMEAELAALQREVEQEKSEKEGGGAQPATTGTSHPALTEQSGSARQESEANKPEASANPVKEALPAE